jgi:hypothetical protein
MIVEWAGTGWRRVGVHVDYGVDGDLGLFMAWYGMEWRSEDCADQKPGITATDHRFGALFGGS